MRRRSLGKAQPPSGDRRALRSMGGVGGRDQCGGCAWRKDFSLDGQFQIDPGARQRRQIRRTSNPAGLAVGSHMRPRAQIAADIA
jgi:hypothetical protein